MKKIKILETIRQGRIGGGERHVLDLVKHINRDFFEPVVLTFTDGEMVDELKKMDVTTHVLPTEKPFDIRIWGTVAKLMHSLDIDLVHSHGTRAFSNCFWAAKKLDIPTLYTVHGWSFHPDQSPIVQKIRTMSERFLSRRALLNILVSDGNFKEGIEKFNLNNSIVVKNGVNLENFNTKNQDTKDFRQEIGVNSTEILVGMIARITTQKDPLTFVKAAKIILAKNKNFKFLVVGDGELKHKAIEYAKQQKIYKHFIFLNFRNDVPTILKAIDIYCLPSLWEGLPIGILEAMAMGKPIVASEIVGNRELIQHGENGLLFPTKNETKLAEAITTLSVNHMLRIEMGLKNREIIEREYDIKKMVFKIERIYKKIYSKEKLFDEKPISSTIYNL